MIERKSGWRWLFLLKGVWNCGLTTLLFVQMCINYDKMSASPKSLLAYQPMFLALGFAFGIGYWWVGRDVTRNHDLVRLGIFGQLSVFVIVSVAFYQGLVSTLEYVPALIDLVCAVLFMIFLARFRRGLRPEG